MRPIIEYGAECWDMYREGQVIGPDRVQKKTAKFATRTNASVWETLAQRRKIARKRALFKGYTRECEWKGNGDRLQGPCYLSKEEYNRKIRVRKKRKDIRKF